MLTLRAPRRDRTRAAFLLWGGWLLVTMAVFSFAQGIIHPYYTVALAPAIGALVGMGAVELWRRRDRWFARGALAAALALSAWWAYAMLGRTPEWNGWLRWLVLVIGIVAAVGVLAAPVLARGLRRTVVLLGLGAALAAPLAFTIDAVATPASGAIPTAGPSSSFGGAGGFAAAGPVGAFGAGGVGRTGAGRAGGGFTPGGGAFQRARAGLAPPGFSGAGPAPSTGGFSPPGLGSGAGPGFGSGFARRFAGRGGAGTGSGGGAGGLLNASTPGAAVIKLLQADANHYTWVAAAVGANTAAGYQLGSDDPVMAIGGFNGTDPDPSLAAFKKLVSEGKVHYFISGGLRRFGVGFARRWRDHPRRRVGHGRAPGAGRRSRGVERLVGHHELGGVALQVDDRGGVTLYDLSPSKG